MVKAKGGGAKKKGPKGKKARAKAKLEKQWGEHVDEDEQKAAKYARRGKSRLASKGMLKKKKSVQFDEDAEAEPSTRLTEQEEEQQNEAGDDNLEESDDDDDDPEDMQLQGGAFSSLLRSISKKTKKADKKQTSRNDDNEESDEKDDEMEADISESDDDEEADGAVVADDNDEPGTGGAEDPFTAHFNRDTLPEKESDIMNILVEAQCMTKVSTPALEESLDVQLSERLADDVAANAIKPNQDAERSQEMWSGMASELFVYNRKVLKENWKKVNRSAFKSNAGGLVTVNKDAASCHLNSLQSVLYPALTSYADLLITAETTENQIAMNNAISLHLLNHVLTSRGRVSRNNKRVKDAAKAETEVTENVRDQGYTRPTVLILLPTRGVCYSFIKNSMLDLLGDSADVEDMDRFDAEFGPIAEEGSEANEADAARRHRKKVLETKGKEWNDLFGDTANNDDDFKIGLSFSPKAVKETKQGGTKSAVGVRLYTDFYKSDIIVTSPLALKMATSGDDNDDNDGGDTDFLSSIEICYIGSSDVLMMQNWDHVNAAFDSMNEQPTRNNNTDFSRVREYLLAGQAKYWRQLIVCSKFTDPSILSSFKRHATSFAGTLKVRSRVPVNDASLANVMIPTKQVFQRVPCKSFSSQGESRLEYFEHHVLPQIQRTKQKHTMIYIPSYFEFIAVRNLLLKREMEFVSVTEYARATEISRGRARFLQGRKPIMLYTGRAHFFARHTIKGAKHLLFFGLPEHSEFYSQIVNMLNMGISSDDGMDGGGGSSSCLALFTKYEAHALERICGKQNCERMLKGEKSTFMFVS